MTFGVNNDRAIIAAAQRVVAGEPSADVAADYFGFPDKPNGVSEMVLMVVAFADLVTRAVDEIDRQTGVVVS